MSSVKFVGGGRRIAAIKMNRGRGRWNVLNEKPSELGITPWTTQKTDVRLYFSNASIWNS